MTKEEFLLYHKACVDEWKKLSENGDYMKSNDLKFFLNECPACHLSYMARINRRINEERQDCKLCPITTWRNYAIKNKYIPGMAACDNFRMLYFRWGMESDPEKRKEIALKISRLKWAFLPRYKKIKPDITKWETPI